MNNTIAYKLAQLPPGTLFVGIDPHKHQHTICVMDQRAQILAKFRIANIRPGFNDLLQRCETLRQHAGAATCLFAIESGAHYWRNLAYFLTQQKYTFRLINPFTLKRQRDGDDLMRRKNDYRDAQKAAELLREGKYTWTAMPEGPYAQLRQLHLTYQGLVANGARVKVQITTAIDQLFPEFTSVFKAVDGETALTILRTCPDPAQIAAQSEAEFVTNIRQHHTGRRLMTKKVCALYRLAPTSVSVQAGTEAQVDNIYLLARQLLFVHGQRQWAEDQLVAAFAGFTESKYLLSIHGLGSVNAAALLADIGDIRHFSNCKQLSKLAGVVPSENQSADNASSSTPMSKHGRPILRMVAHRAVVSLIRHNDVFKQYVQRLKERPAGEHPLRTRAAMGAAMNKLLRIVYALLSKRQMFDAKIALAA